MPPFYVSMSWLFFAPLVPLRGKSFRCGLATPFLRQGVPPNAVNHFPKSWN